MEQLALKLLKIQCQIRIFHWMAKPEPKHRALGSYYDSIDDLTDRLIENVSGSRGELLKLPKMEGFTLANLGDNASLVKYLKDINIYMLDGFWKDAGLKKDEHEEIFNIVQEYMGATNKLLYLLLLGE